MANDTLGDGAADSNVADRMLVKVSVKPGASISNEMMAGSSVRVTMRQSRAEEARVAAKEFSPVGEGLLRS